MHKMAPNGESSLEKVKKICAAVRDPEELYQMKLAIDAALARSKEKKHPAFTREGRIVVQQLIENDLEEVFKVAERKIETREQSCSEDEEEESAGHEWSATEKKISMPFVATPELQFGTAKTPLDFFKLLFNEEFVALLVDCVNSRGLRFAQEKKKNFTPTDIQEIYTMISVFFCMGFYTSILTAVNAGKRPNPKINFANCMRHGRMLLVHSLLACNEEDDDSAWYEAVKPIGQKFNDTMQKLMVPERMLNLDENTSMYLNNTYPFASRKEHIRLHFLSDMNNIFQRVYVADPLVAVSGRHVAKALMTDFLFKGYILHTSPRYTSIALAEELACEITYLTGYLNEKKFQHPAFLNKNFKSENLQRRTHCDGKGTRSLVVSGYNRCGVCVCKVFNQNVTLLSTNVNGCQASDNKWECKMIEELNKNAPASQKSQAAILQCGPRLDTRYNHLMDYVLKAMMINAYLMYELTSEKKMSFLDFLEEILYQMLPLEAKP